MGELTLAYQARCYSAGIVGRSICNARNHHWVAENTGGDAVGAGEMFCASIAARSTTRSASSSRCGASATTTRVSSSRPGR